MAYCWTVPDILFKWDHIKIDYIIHNSSLLSKLDYTEKENIKRK